MPWRETARDEYRRESGRYPSDMTDREWALIEPFMPPVRRHGRAPRGSVTETAPVPVRISRSVR